MSEIKNIKFSEETKEFETGAHRGGGSKYPMEYLPLVEVIQVLKIANSLPSYNEEDGYIKISENIELFKKTGKLNLIAEAGAIFGKLNFKNMFECLGQTSLHFKQGADKYGYNNWQLGMRLFDYVGSLSRHLVKIVEKWDDEPHETAFMWNIFAIMWTVKKLPQMNNLPIQKQ